MSYKIAVASSDGVHIDLSFGAAKHFIIYEVSRGDCSVFETRAYMVPEDTVSEQTASLESAHEGCGMEAGCSGSSASGCGSHSGCSGAGEGVLSKVQLIADCRCIVCRKIGFHVQKQLEKLAITGFDVECTVESALKKITLYLDRVDGHQSLRGIADERSN